jgi:cyanase
VERLDALLLVVLVVARVRIDTLAEAAVLPMRQQDVARHPFLGALLSEQAMTLLQTLELDLALAPQLTTYPVKGALDPVIPTDPLLYRFYEILQVYGLPLKDVIQEKFGDGIMSAIDFTLHVDKVDDPKGDRVKVTMNGKFLPYRKW